VQSGNFLRKFEIYPNLVITLAHEDLKEPKDIIKLSNADATLPQLLMTQHFPWETFTSLFLYAET